MENEWGGVCNNIRNRKNKYLALIYFLFLYFSRILNNFDDDKNFVKRI